MELSKEMEVFIESRLKVLQLMEEGETKERAIRNAVELMKANTEFLKVIYSNSLEMAKLDSSESLERDKLNQTKEIELLKLGQTKELEEFKAAQSKEIELRRFDHEMNLEELRAVCAKDAKRLEKAAIPERLFQYGLRLTEIAVPVALFVYAAKIENLNGYLPNVMKSVTTKIPIFRR